MAVVCRADGPYHFIKEIPIAATAAGILLAGSGSARLYVSHGTEVVVIDLAKDKSSAKSPTPPASTIAVARTKRGFPATAGK